MGTNSNSSDEAVTASARMNVIMKTKNIPVDNAKAKNRHMVLIFFQTKKHYTKLKMKSRSNDFKLDTY